MREEAMKKLKYLSVILATFSLLLASGPARATNGLQAYGVGPIQLALGGAGVAMPQTSYSLYINPAGMNNVGNQADLSFTVAFPDSFMGTSLAPAGNPSAVNVSSSDDAAFIPGGAIVFRPFGSERFSLGVGLIPASGFQIEYPISRFPSALTMNKYDTSARYGLFKILPAFSIRILDNLSIGGGVDINYAFLHADSATLAPGFPETMGRSRFDSTLGIGGRIGVLYAPIDMLSIGAMYVFRSRFQPFDRYTDLLNTGLDMPQQFHFGLALKPAKGLTLLGDFKWLDWSGTGVIGRSIAAGGIQWRDQYVFAGGAQYNFEHLIGLDVDFRLGYNYGQSPITPTNAFRNITIPTVIEHHFTLGLGMMLGEHIGADLAYFHEFSNTVTDNGSGSPTGTGSFVGTSANGFSVGIRGTWGPKGPPRPDIQPEGEAEVEATP